MILHWIEDKFQYTLNAKPELFDLAWSASLPAKTFDLSTHAAEMKN